VLSKAGGRYRVRVGNEVLVATLRGRFKLRQKGSVLVGDCVQVSEHRDGSATIEHVLPRTSLLRRRAPGKSKGVRNVAANVQKIVVVGAVRQPDWEPNLIDRFLAIAEVNHLPATLVLNKCDLDPDPGRYAEAYRLAGYSVVLTSVPECRGLDGLRSVLEGHISLFTGPTGVGKSSLLNALQPGLRLRTGGVSRKAGSGRHTTVAAEMFPFGQDGFVVDTPGLRDVGLWGLDPQEVSAAFPEFTALSTRCRFDNCRHLEEPGCAVIAALTKGEVAETRHRSYRRLLEESADAARRR